MPGTQTDDDPTEKVALWTYILCRLAMFPHFKRMFSKERRTLQNHWILGDSKNRKIL